MVCVAFGSLGLDGEELLLLPANILHNRLAKSGADDATTLAKQVIEQRDKVTHDNSTSPPAGAGSNECPICFERYQDDESGTLVYHGYHTNMLHSKPLGCPFGCPLCHQVTKVC